MANFRYTFNAISPLFILMALGYFLRVKRGYPKSFFDAINKFCFAIALPCTLFKSTYKAGVRGSSTAASCCSQPQAIW